MRTIADIKKEMTDSFVADPVIAEKYELQPGLSFEEQFSKVSLESLIFYIVAVCIWSLENILNISITQQNAHILATKIHSLTWYSDYAKKFQVGDTLPWGEVEYDLDNPDNRIVKFAACSKTPGGLMVKIAGLNSSNELQPIAPVDFDAFKEYMFRISAAGDYLFFTNEEADELKLSIDIYYDPLVLNSQGQRLDGSNDQPVKEAIEAYIKGIDFDGKLIPTFLIDALQLIEGVNIPVIQEAYYRYGLLTGWMPIPDDGVNPFAGYLRIVNPSDLNINYIAS